jgi:hypothetical protein
MINREHTIAHVMNYCQHYGRSKKDHRIMVCKAGMDLHEIQCVETGGVSKMKWGPCIEGHLLKDPCSHCSKWIRGTREQGERRADLEEKFFRKLQVVTPLVNAWRKKFPNGKVEVVECPECKGRLHLEKSSYNGHVKAQCETPECVNWIE